jgi:hypothetical protein
LSNTSAINFQSQYDSASESLGKAVIRSTTFYCCEGQFGGAFAIWKGISRISEVCVRTCSSNGKFGNAFSVFGSTSVSLSLSTISRSTGSGRETVHLSSTDEILISSVNYSWNSQNDNSTGCGGFSVDRSETVFPFDFHHLLVEHSTGETFLQLGVGPESKFSSSVFVIGCAVTFIVDIKVTFVKCSFVGQPIQRKESAVGLPSVVFNRCTFSFETQPVLSGCVFDQCEFGILKTIRLQILDTKLCGGQLTASGEWNFVSGAVWLMLIAIVGIGMVLFFGKNLRFNIRFWLKVVMIVLVIAIVLLLCMSSGILTMPIVLAVAGYLVYTYREKFGEVLRIQAFVDGTKRRVAGFTQMEGASPVEQEGVEARPELSPFPITPDRRPDENAMDFS